MISSAPVAQSHADAWSLLTKQEFVTIVGSSRVTVKVPVGRGGRFDGVEESDMASGGGLWVTVAVGVLRLISIDSDVLALEGLTQQQLSQSGPLELRSCPSARLVCGLQLPRRRRPIIPREIRLQP